MHDVEVEDVGLTEVDAIENSVEVLTFAGGEIVHATHLIALSQDGTS
jgi:hypothetical protein